MSTSQGKIIKIKPDSFIKFFPLTAQSADEKNIFLGSKVTGCFVIVNEAWRSLTELSKGPTTIHDIAAIFKLLNPRFLNPKDQIGQIELMILHLAENGLVEKIDDEILFGHKIVDPTYKESPTWSRGLFRKPFVVFYFFLALLAFFLPITWRNLIPTTADFYWWEYFSFSYLTFFCFSWITGVIHEYAHFWVAGSQGVKSKFEISHRLNFLVLQTKYPNIFSIPKKWRIATFLAGIFLDLIIISIVYILLIASDISYTKLPPVIYKLLKQLVLVQWLSISWEFLFYMKTDVYFAIREVTGVHNLYTYALLLVKSWVFRKKFPFVLPQRTFLIVKAYTLFFMIGTAVAIVRYGFYQIPIMVNLTIGALSKVIEGSKNSQWQIFADGIIVLTIEAFAIIILIYTLYKEHKTTIRRWVEGIIYFKQSG